MTCSTFCFFLTKRDYYIARFAYLSYWKKVYESDHKCFLFIV